MFFGKKVELYRMSKLYKNLTPILIILVWLMPVSNVLNTLNESMARNCYILNLILLAFVFCAESKINIKQMGISVGILIVLAVCTILTVLFGTGTSTVSYGYLHNYVPFCILINLRPLKLSKSEILDFLLVLSSILIIMIGILTVVGNPIVEMLLKKYYINHYAHVYTVMWEGRKTVTFFATHSISCYIYYLMWWMLDYRLSMKKDMLSKVLIMGMLFCIVMCLSTSAVFCLCIIIGVYYLRWAKKTTAKNITRSLVLICVIIVAIIANYDTISVILSSNVNGLNGRFGQSGSLVSSLKYAVMALIPIGLCDISGLWLTDGGYFINFIRGGIPLIVLYYYGLYLFLKRNIRDKRKRLELFVGLMLFEVGYQFTMYMRFFMIMLLLVLYFNHYGEQQEYNETIIISARYREQ